MESRLIPAYHVNRIDPFHLTFLWSVLLVDLDIIPTLLRNAVTLSLVISVWNLNNEGYADDSVLIAGIEN